MNERTSTLRVICAGGYRAAMEHIANEFTAKSGVSLELTFGTPAKTRELVTQGSGFDAAVVTKGSLDAAAAEQLEQKTMFVVAKSPVGVGVRDGIPVQPIGSVEQFASFIRSLGSVGLSDPAAGTNLGADILNAADKVGLGQDLRSRVKFIHGPGSAVSTEVGKGHPDAVITLISEIKNFAGVQFVGNIPDAMGLGTPFVAGIALHPNDRAAAESLLDYLRSAPARVQMERTGLVPMYD
jgi:ABC-type molybdate transport system substrate-binding protein